MKNLIAFLMLGAASALAVNNDVDLYVQHDENVCGAFHIVAKSPGLDDREFAGVQILSTWNDALMSLESWTYRPTHFWFGEFVEDGQGINGTCDPDCDGIDDGDAIFLMLGEPQNPPVATPEGEVIATFIFDLAGNTSLSIDDVINGFAATKVTSANGDVTGDLHNDDTGECFAEGKGGSQ